MTNPTEPSPSRTSKRIGERKKRAASALEAEQAAGAAAFAVGGGTGSSSNRSSSNRSSSKTKASPKKARTKKIVTKKTVYANNPGLTMLKCRMAVLELNTERKGKSPKSIGSEPNRVRDVHLYSTTTPDNKEFPLDIPEEFRLYYNTADKRLAVLPTDLPNHNDVLTTFCLSRMGGGMHLLGQTDRDICSNHVPWLQAIVLNHILVGTEQMSSFNFEQVVLTARAGAILKLERDGGSLNTEVTSAIFRVLQQPRQFEIRQDAINNSLADTIAKSGVAFTDASETMKKLKAEMDAGLHHVNNRVDGCEAAIKDLQIRTEAHEKQFERLRVQNTPAHEQHRQWDKYLAAEPPQIVYGAAMDGSFDSASTTTNDSVCKNLFGSTNPSEAAPSAAAAGPAVARYSPSLSTHHEEDEAADSLIALHADEASNKRFKSA